ncbi:MAG: amino acid ABC transporter substrate-binding protein [Vulcanimicrobiaceae bacterium]
MRILRVLVLLAFIVATVPGRGMARPTVVFGCALSFTGALANEGQLIREGYDFWARYVNDRGGLHANGQDYDVEIRYADDESNPSMTAARLETMITEDHINFILGPFGSAETLAASSVAERHGIPMISSAGAAERIFNQGYHYSFGVLSPARKYLVGIIEYAVKRNPRPRTVAISAAEDPFSLEVQQGAVQSANDHGLKVVYADHYKGDPASVAAAAAAIKAAHPDIVLNAGHLRDAIQMHRALKEQHVQAMIYGYSVGPDTAEFRVALGSDSQAVLGSAQWSSAVTYEGSSGFYRRAHGYATAFKRQVGHEPEYHNAEASAAGLAFQYAIDNAGSLDLGAVRNALAKLDVVTFFGLIKFDERGVNMWKPMVVNQIQGDHLATIYPYRLADAKPIYPAPGWAY